MRYRTRKSSLVKYPTHPSGRGRKRPLTGPRDVWDISLGMISSFDIAKYCTRLRLVQYFSINVLYFCLGAKAPRQKYSTFIDGNVLNITRFLILTILYCIKYRKNLGDILGGIFRWYFWIVSKNIDFLETSIDFLKS